MLLRFGHDSLLSWGGKEKEWVGPWVRTVNRMSRKYHHDFGTFWYFYLSQHMKPGTRAFHYVGTWIAFLTLPVAIADQFVDFLGWGTLRWALIPAGIATTYALGFISHWTIEKNQPATFVYPGFSVGGDLYMTWRITTRRIHDDVKVVKDRLASGWAVDRYGFYPPDYAKANNIQTDRRLVSYVAAHA